RPQGYKGQDQSEVGGVEDVSSVPADEVLRRHRDGDHADEDPDPMEAPPVAVDGTRDTQDESGAVAGEQSAGGPEEGLVLEDADAELDERAGSQAGQDLRHREPKAENCLAQRLEGQQHRGDVQPGIADAGQDDAVFATADPDSYRPAAAAHGRITVTAMGRWKTRMKKNLGDLHWPFSFVARVPTPIAAATLPLGLGLPTTRALESGAAGSLTGARSCQITGSY